MRILRDLQLLNTHYRADYTSDIRNVALARRGVAGFASACGFSETEIADIRLAAGEALSNAVEHGSAGASALGFTVECRFDGSELSIEVRDGGNGFPMPGNHGSIKPDHRGRGFGIFLMRRLMDDVAFSSNGTVVRLVRRHSAGRRLSLNGERVL
ncbi:MAG TPA: ATP-binding protein [Candidatus Cybelea sp.]